MVTILVFVAALAVAWYVLIVRPQQAVSAAHEQLLGGLAAGAHVMTVGGIYGMVEAVDGDVAVIRTGPNTTARVAVDGIARVVSDDHAALEQHQNSVATQAESRTEAHHEHETTAGAPAMYGQPQQNPHGQPAQPGHQYGQPQQPFAQPIPGQQQYVNQPMQVQAQQMQGSPAYSQPYVQAGQPAALHPAQPQAYAQPTQQYAPLPQQAQQYAPQQAQQYVAQQVQQPGYAPTAQQGSPYAPAPAAQQFGAQVTSVGQPMAANPLAMNYAQTGPPPAGQGFHYATVRGQSAQDPDLQGGSFAPRPWTAPIMPITQAPVAQPPVHVLGAWPTQQQPVQYAQPPLQQRYTPPPVVGYQPGAWPPQAQPAPYAPQHQGHAVAPQQQYAAAPPGFEQAMAMPAQPSGQPTETRSGSALSEVPQHFQQAIARYDDVREILDRARSERSELADHYRKSVSPLVRTDELSPLDQQGTPVPQHGHPLPFSQPVQPQGQQQFAHGFPAPGAAIGHPTHATVSAHGAPLFVTGQHPIADGGQYRYPTTELPAVPTLRAREIA